MAHQGAGHIDEDLSAPCLLQQLGVEHKEEDKGHAAVDAGAEDGFCGEGGEGKYLGEAGPGVADGVGHIGAHIGIDQEDNADGDQSHAGETAAGFDDQDQHDGGQNDLKLGVHADVQAQLHGVGIHIHRKDDGEEHGNDLVDVQLFWVQLFADGLGQICEDQREGHVNRALLHRCQHAEKSDI